MKWWEQAGYIARALERVATELESSVEAAETDLYQDAYEAVRDLLQGT
jgi:hypothetical protein